jgi:hypothetical protein
MVTPKPETALFCQFLFDIKWIKLTPARKDVVTQVQIAAENQQPVSDLTWSNFLLSTYRWYIVWLENVNFNPNEVVTDDEEYFYLYN